MNIVLDPLEQKTKKCTSDYKSRNKARPNHNGMDLISYSSKNNYVVAVERGKVSYSGYDSKSGYYVFILHDNGYKTFYCHMKKGSVLVKKGDIVCKGQRLGLMGDSGSATGVHLHFGVKNKVPAWIDPLPVLEGKVELAKNYSTGTYKLTKAKYLRTSPEVNSKNKLIYNNLMQYMKEKCTKDTKGYAKFKIGAKVEVTGFATDTKGNTWAKIKTINTPVYFCLHDSTGDQAIKI